MGFMQYLKELSRPKVYSALTMATFLFLNSARISPERPIMKDVLGTSEELIISYLPGGLGRLEIKIDGPVSRYVAYTRKMSYIEAEDLAESLTWERNISARGEFEFGPTYWGKLRKVENAEINQPKKKTQKENDLV